jgi:hypothetical protein
VLSGRTRAGALLAVCLVSLAPRFCPAAEGSTLEVKHEYFWDRNGVWNHTPAFSLRMALSRLWTFGWEQEIDVVSGASRYLGSGNTGPFGGTPDAVSGASKVEVRTSGNPSLTWSSKGRTASLSLYYSREDDYLSRSPAASISWDFNERNTTLGISYGEFFDEYRPRGAFAGTGGSKRLRTVGVTLAQSLTPLTLVAATATRVESWGYLGRPYNPPMADDGAQLAEALPGRKAAYAVAGQIVQGFLAGGRLGSINLDVRRFGDSWGLKSTTADLKVGRYVSEGTYVRLRCRYYQQTGALFAKPWYAGNEEYRTADIRFFPFTSVLAGIKVAGRFPAAFDENAFLPDGWDLKYDHLVRDTRGDAAPDGISPRRTTYQLYDPDERYLQGTFMAGLIFNL